VNGHTQPPTSARRSAPTQTREDRARTHIKAVIETLKEQEPGQLAQPAGLFMSGMLTGLAASIEILGGGTAEGSLEAVNTRLATAIGEAYLNGSLPGVQQERPAPSDAVHAERAEAERDGAYRERAHLVALLAALTPGAVVAPAHDVEESGWWIAYLNIGGQQASWHISPRDTDLFAGVEQAGVNDPRAQWDGHTTEEKYAWIADYTAGLLRQCGPECSEGHAYAGRCESARNR
jgi:hypothetical protein